MGLNRTTAPVLHVGVDDDLVIVGNTARGRKGGISAPSFTVLDTTRLAGPDSVIDTLAPFVTGGVIIQIDDTADLDEHELRARVGHNDFLIVGTKSTGYRAGRPDVVVKLDEPFPVRRLSTLRKTYEAYKTQHELNKPVLHARDDDPFTRENGQTIVYTDASFDHKDNSGAGAIVSKDGAFAFTIDVTASHTAELVAAEFAISTVDTGTVVATDCATVISEFGNHPRIKNGAVTLVKVKGHAGIVGNELADHFASTARGRELCGFFPREHADFAKVTRSFTEYA